MKVKIGTWVMNAPGSQEHSLPNFSIVGGGQDSSMTNYAYVVVKDPAPLAAVIHLDGTTTGRRIADRGAGPQDVLYRYNGS